MTNTTRRALPVRPLIGILMLALLASASVGSARADDDPASGTTHTVGPSADPLRWRGGLHRPGRDTGPTVPVPEPATMTLAAMGLIALGTAIRKRKK